MKRAWVLAGGGAKGAWQAGAMCALQRKGEYPDYLFGTSVGALNAACYTFGGIDSLFEVWSCITKTSDIFARRWNPFGNSFFDSSPLKKLIKKVVGQKQKTGATAYACYADLWTGETRYANSAQMDFQDFVLASASLPVICPPVDGRFVDGGVTEPCPLKQAVRMGADEITVILCSSLVLYEKRPVGKMEIALRTLDCACAELVRNDVSLAITRNSDPDYRKIDIRVIQPEPLWTMGTLEFNQDSISQAFVAGSDAVK